MITDQQGSSQEFQVPYIDLPRQYQNLKNEIDLAVHNVLKTGSFILRDEVTKFENAMAEFLHCKHVIGVNSGTDALQLALYAHNFAEGSEVITVGHTFIATIATIKHCRLVPILVDIGEDFNMDASKLKGAITSKTKAIIPVHINGRPCKMDAITKIANEHGLSIIEDSCQALGASYLGKKTGTYGVGCFSLHPMKILGCAGDGGFISVNDDILAERIRLLRNHGQRNKENIAFYGFSSRLDNLQAAIVNVKMKYVQDWIERRRQIAQEYQSCLSEIKEITLPHAPHSSTEYYDVYNSYCILCQDRDQLYEYLRKAKIEVFKHLSVPNHTQRELDLRAFSLPKTEEVSNLVLSLPIYPEMNNEQIQYVVNTIKQYYS